MPNLDKEIEKRKEELRAEGDTTYTDEDAIFYDEGAHNLFFGNAGRDRDRIIEAVAKYQMQRDAKERD